MLNSIYAFLPLVSGISALWLGVVVLLNNRKSDINKSLFRAIICIVIWLFGTALMFIGDGVKWAIFFDRLAYIGVIYIPITIYHFGLSVAKTDSKRRLISGYVISTIFLLLSQTNYFVNNIYQYAWGVHTQARFFHNLFLIYFVIYIVMFFLNIYSYRRNVVGIEKAQANYILFAFLILNLSSLAFLPAYGIDIPPFTYFFAAICVLILTLAITRYQLFNTKVILTEMLVAIMGIILLAVPFFMPTITLRILTGIVFILFLIFAYYLIEATHRENQRREFAEKIAFEERALREEAELVAVHERDLREQAEALANNLKRLDDAKTQFLLSTQHHLRSPLTVIQGYLSMVSEGSYGKIPAEANNKIAVSLESTQKLIHLVNDLLDVARFQMDKGMVAKEPTDTVKLIGEIVADLEKAAQAKKICLRFVPPAETIPLISVDPRGIREALYNIVDNAIKYTQKGGVTVSVVVAGKRLRVSVADTGIGMNEKDRQGLFTRTFERGEKAKNVNVNGKGIGLYLAAQMIVSNGGTIRAESAGWGKGTEFIIGLPMYTIPSPAVPPRPASGVIAPPVPVRRKAGAK